MRILSKKGAGFLNANLLTNGFLQKSRHSLLYFSNAGGDY